MEARLALPADAAAMAALHAACFGAARWSFDQIASSLALPTSHAWLAVEDGAVRGFILCQLVADEAEVLTFCVCASHRRNGLGAALMALAVTDAREAGAARLFLEVAADNAAARALYEKQGFAVTGVRPHYYPREQGAMDAIMYALDL